jgi:protein-L-isoaspartate(D-aspartate) O-methyltransferase
MVDAGIAQQWRDRMVDGLVERGAVADRRVAVALRAVHRHLFVPEISAEQAYEDRAVVTKFEDGRPSSSASQPSIVAAMLDQLKVGPGHSVLEIGTGTGYNAALLAHLVGETGRVVTVDIAPDLVEGARERLARTAVGPVDVICGDGADGWAKGAPYDRIIVTAGSSDLAPAWWEQLDRTGRLVLPLSLAGVQQCVAFAWTGDHLESRSVCDCGFMPLHGTMAHGDGHYPIPGHPGVAVDTRPGLGVDVESVARALSQPAAVVDIGVRVTPAEVAGSLRRWLAFHEPCQARLACTGDSEEVARSVVPGLLDIPLDGSRRRRETTILLGDRGLAALDRTDQDDPATPDPGQALPSAARGFGTATSQTESLVELVRAWDAAGRPTTGAVRIAAYKGSDHPPVPPRSLVERARHTTFVVTI